MSVAFEKKDRFWAPSVSFEFHAVAALFLKQSNWKRIGMGGTVLRPLQNKWGLSLVLGLITGCAAPAWKWDGTPPNDLPNPYTSNAPWGKLPEGHKWGALNGVAVDNDGR